MDSGATLAGVDLLYQGEFLADGQPVTTTRRVANTREFAGFTLGYNHPLFSQRVHDILTLVAFCKFSKYEPAGVTLIGLGKQAGSLAAAAPRYCPAPASTIPIPTGSVSTSPRSGISASAPPITARLARRTSRNCSRPRS